MKKLLCFSILTLSLVILIFSCQRNNIDEQAKITTLFQENQELILSSVASGDFSQVEQLDGIDHVYVSEDYIEFSCGGAGFGPNTSYFGFFYSPTDDMTALDGGICPPEELVPSGNGYRWQEKTGDNEYYVEKLAEHFFYFQLKF